MAYSDFRRSISDRSLGSRPDTLSACHFALPTTRRRRRESGDTYLPASPRADSRCLREIGGPPRFLGNPGAYMPCSLTPAGWYRSGQYNRSILPSDIYTASAPTARTFRGSITRPAHSLSTLRRSRLPASTQDSLLAGDQPLPGGIGYPPGSLRNFRTVILSSFPSDQACLAHINLSPFLPFLQMVFRMF